MRQALIINRTNALSSVIDIRDIEEIYEEEFYTSGMVLFFDKDHELILWACSYDDILSIAKEFITEEIYGYHIVKDLIKPYTEKEVDAMYDGVCNEVFSMVIVNRGDKMKVVICLN